MKFIDLTTKYKISKERLKVGISIGLTVLVSAVSVVVIKTLIDNQEQTYKQQINSDFIELLNEKNDDPTTTSTDLTEISEIVATFVSTDVTSSVEPSSPTESAEPTTPTSTEATATTEPTSGSTAQTVPSYNETSLIKKVYASAKINVRSGPGTNYDVVKQIEQGDAVDVIGITDTGWYHTYNDNWVLKDLCQDTPVVAPANPTPVPVQTYATTKAPTTSTTAPVSTPSGMTFHGNCLITFYGPQPLKDGSYSTTTATGTTCVQGVTCASDWSVIPSGTIIYIENDPLGGDGYYTVEDNGPGVQGDHIDIYADDGQSGAYNTTRANVYIVN